MIDTALKQLSHEYEVLVLEGAGSPVEMNLKDRELVNMKIAEIADVPVFLVADIDRGGIFASIVGTLDLLTGCGAEKSQRNLINKFRGDPKFVYRRCEVAGGKDRDSGLRGSAVCK